METNIAGQYSGLDLTVETFPADNAVEPKAYITALVINVSSLLAIHYHRRCSDACAVLLHQDSFEKGDAVTIFTPDDTHFEIAMAAVQRGLHVLVTKVQKRSPWHSCPTHAITVAGTAPVSLC